MIIILFGENVKPFGGLHWASTLLRLVGEAVWWIDGVTAGRDVVVLQACVALLCEDHHSWCGCLSYVNIHLRDCQGETLRICRVRFHAGV